MNSPTCGQGLAVHSAVPAKLSELISAMAENLEAHMKALDLNDENSRQEFEVYVKVAQQHREIAGQLQETGLLMAGQRGLPMGRHDSTAMADPMVMAAFEKLVRVETELVELMQGVLETHRSMVGSWEKLGKQSLVVVDCSCSARAFPRS